MLRQPSASAPEVYHAIQPCSYAFTSRGEIMPYHSCAGGSRLFIEGLNRLAARLGVASRS